jgi:hypothetical protein
MLLTRRRIAAVPSVTSKVETHGKGGAGRVAT